MTKQKFFKKIIWRRAFAYFDKQFRRLKGDNGILFLSAAPAPDPASEAAFAALLLGLQLGLEARHLQVVDGKVEEERLAGDCFKFWRESDQIGLAFYKVGILGKITLSIHKSWPLGEKVGTH